MCGRVSDLPSDRPELPCWVINLNMSKWMIVCTGNEADHPESSEAFMFQFLFWAAVYWRQYKVLSCYYCSVV